VRLAGDGRYGLLVWLRDGVLAGDRIDPDDLRGLRVV
jgi:hypothetical protein